MTVETLVADARSYVQQVLEPADAALEAAVAAVQQVGFTQLTYNPVPLPAAPLVPDTLSAPVMPDVTLDLPAEPADTLLFQDISPIEAGPQPTLNATVPSFTLPTQPSALAEFAATLPAIDTDLVFPDPPAVLMNPLIEAPNLIDRSEPERPQVMLPAFTAVAPTDLPAAPTDLQGSVASAYRDMAPSTIAMMDGYVDAMLAKFNPKFAPAMAAIEAQLARFLDGGSGFNPAVETAIYERSRTKQNAESARVRDTVYKDAADRGFTLPPIALLSGVQKARQDGADNNAQSAREIVVLQAEMEQKNLQFAVTTSSGLRTTLLNSAISYHQNLITINGQAIDYAKTILSSIIEVYNTAVKAYEARLDGYKAEAAVFETRLKSAMAGIELYRVEIAALEALANVDKAKVDVYRARIDALQVYANVYRAQIEAVQGRASLEKMKIEVFGAQVQAFGAQVQAKNGEWLGYKAAIEGNQAQASLYAEEVRAFGIEIDAWGRQISAKAELARSQAQTNEARASNFRAVMSGYTAVVQARGEVARTKLENNRQSVIAFEAETRASIATATLRSDYYKYTGEIAIKNADLSIRAIVDSANLQRDYSKSIATLHSANATIHGNLAAAAMSGMNTLAADTLTE